MSPTGIGPVNQVGELFVGIRMQSFLIQTASASLAGTVLIYAAALAGVAMHYRIKATELNTVMSLGGFFRHLFPSHIIWSRWTRFDTMLYCMDKLLFGIARPSASTLVAVTASVFRTNLIDSGIHTVSVQLNLLSLSVFILLGLLLRDFVAFYIHLLQHRVPLLWEFHKVHHAPESLIPPTSRRIHPLEQLLNVAVESVPLGVLTGVFACLTNETNAQLIGCSTGMYLIINIVTLSPLRHSHIDLRLGRLEHILLSPAHHHLHHSVERHHWDKNFGTIFPLWDFLWHTLAHPSQLEVFRLGLPDDMSENYAGLTKFYIMPFKKVVILSRELGTKTIARVAPIANYPVPISPEATSSSGK